MNILYLFNLCYNQSVNPIDANLLIQLLESVISNYVLNSLSHCLSVFLSLNWMLL